MPVFTFSTEQPGRRNECPRCEGKWVIVQGTVGGGEDVRGNVLEKELFYTPRDNAAKCMEKISQQRSTSNCWLQHPMWCPNM